MLWKLLSLVLAISLYFTTNAVLEMQYHVSVMEWSVKVHSDNIKVLAKNNHNLKEALEGYKLITQDQKELISASINYLEDCHNEVYELERKLYNARSPVRF